MKILTKDLQKTCLSNWAPPPYGESEESEGNDPYDDLPIPVIVMPDDIVFLE